MPICPITYEQLPSTQKYSARGLKLLSPKLTTLNDLPWSAENQRLEAVKHADKMSIQGIQPKLSAVLKIKQSCFDVVDTGGRYILKPQHDLYQQTPENEDLCMRMANTVGIETPLHGLIYSIDNSLTYFIKRFDRVGQKSKIAVEDFSQLAMQNRHTKYNYSMEKLIPLIERYCTFPMLEKTKLLNRTLVNYLIGNEDMHLKKFSVITRNDKVELAPAYDFINSTIALGNAKEELALPLNGKKRNLKRNDFIRYYAIERLKLNQNLVAGLLEKIHSQLDHWHDLISISFLNQPLKDKFIQLLDARIKVLFE